MDQAVQPEVVVRCTGKRDMDQAGQEAEAGYPCPLQSYILQGMVGGMVPEILDYYP